MRPWGRRAVALAGLSCTVASMLCVAAAGLADTFKTEVDLTTRDIGSKETTLGDVVADAMRDATRADIAFIDASAFEESVTIPRGSASTADVLKTLSYKSDDLFVMKLTGDQVRAAVGHGLFLYPKFNSAFLQISGMSIVINPDADGEKRLVSVKVDGAAIEPAKTYKVAMRAPLANGGLAYSKIWKTAEKKDADRTLERAITDYLAGHRSLTKGDDRIANRGK